MKPCRSVWLGRLPYARALDLQKRISALRQADRVPDTLLLLEHPPVITLGKVAKATHLRASAETLRRRGIKVLKVDRGGDITYHGPGQLVGYPILNLQDHRKDVKWYLERLEETLIDCLAGHGVAAGRRPGFTGVWVGEEKIAAIGVRVERWVTRHGFALNVNNGPEGFDLIIPCGISDGGITSLRTLLGRELELPHVAACVAKSFGRTFNLDVAHENQTEDNLAKTFGFA